MDWRQTLGVALRAVADAVDGKVGAAATAAPAPAAKGPARLPDDIDGAFTTAAALMNGLRSGGVNLGEVESVANALQQVAVDLGLEPAGVLMAVEGVEWLLPFVHGLYQQGLVQGGYRPLVGGFAGARGHVY